MSGVEQFRVGINIVAFVGVSDRVKPCKCVVERKLQSSCHSGKEGVGLQSMRGFNDIQICTLLQPKLAYHNNTSSYKSGRGGVQCCLH